MVTTLGKAEKMGARKTVFPALPSAMTMALGKDLKKIQTLPSARQRALGNEFFLKKNQTLPSASQRALGKEIKKKFKLCRVPAIGHSAKNFFLKKNQNFAECHP